MIKIALIKLFNTWLYSSRSKSVLCYYRWPPGVAAVHCSNTMRCINGLTTVNITVTLSSCSTVEIKSTQAFLPVDNIQQFLSFFPTIQPANPHNDTQHQSGGAPTESLEHGQNGDNPPTTDQTRPEDTGPTRDKIAGLVSGHCEARPRDGNVKGVSLKACFLSHAYSLVKPNYS